MGTFITAAHQSIYEWEEEKSDDKRHGELKLRNFLRSIEFYEKKNYWKLTHTTIWWKYSTVLFIYLSISVCERIWILKLSWSNKSTINRVLWIVPHRLDNVVCYNFSLFIECNQSNFLLFLAILLCKKHFVEVWKQCKWKLMRIW